MLGFGRLNMAIVGTGYMAGKMAETIRYVSEVRPYAVCSRSTDRAYEFAQKYGFKKAYGSLQELLEDRKVDLVYIATPHSEHYEQVKMCIEYGRPVLCEKPFCLNAPMAEELLALAHEKHVFAAEAMWIRFLPFAGQILETLRSGIIGEPVMLTAGLGYNVGRVRRMLDPDLGGGALLDIGIYLLNFASMIFGDDISRINAHCTYTALHMDEQESITLRYSSGRIAQLSVSMVGVSDRRAVISGTKGCIVIENVNNFESLTVLDSDHNRISSYKRPGQRTGYEYEIRACAKAIKEDRLEVEQMDHDQIISILHMTDHIRGQLKVRFPQEMDEQELEAYHKFRAEHTASRKAAAAAGADGGEAASAGKLRQPLLRKTRQQCRIRPRRPRRHFFRLRGRAMGKVRFRWPETDSRPEKTCRKHRRERHGGMITDTERTRAWNTESSMIRWGRSECPLTISGAPRPREVWRTLP